MSRRSVNLIGFMKEIGQVECRDCTAKDERIHELEAENAELREAIDSIAQECDDRPDNVDHQRIWELCEPFLKGVESLRKEAALKQSRENTAKKNEAPPHCDDVYCLCPKCHLQEGAKP